MQKFSGFLPMCREICMGAERLATFALHALSSWCMHLRQKIFDLKKRKIVSIKLGGATPCVRKKQGFWNQHPKSGHQVEEICRNLQGCFRYAMKFERTLKG